MLKIREVLNPNSTLPLTKDQAWSFAMAYLQSIGLSNIQPSELKAFGPTEFYDKHNNRIMYWTFEIHRKDASGFEKGGIIIIDAFNGHVTDYSPFA